MPNQFFPAPEVAAIGASLIAKHHDHLAMTDLYKNTVRVEYIFCSETPSKSGRDVWGTARVVSSVGAFLKRRDEMSWEPTLTDEDIEAISDSGERQTAKERAQKEHEARMKKAGMAFFVITISKPIWDFLDETGRIALVDHELMHCTAELDDKGYLKIGTRGHDYEAFDIEVERYGLWRGAANHHFRSMKRGVQMSLDLDGEIEQKTVVVHSFDGTSETVQ